MGCTKPAHFCFTPAFVLIRLEVAALVDLQMMDPADNVDTTQDLPLFFLSST